jgi:hypothetical protein
MATNNYMAGRQKYGRPQGLLFANNPGTIINGKYVPLGNEGSEDLNGDEFIILSDDNRQNIDIQSTRIEERKRTVNGRMRSYHVADKLTISTSWEMLPSRAFDTDPEFSLTTGKPTGTRTILDVDNNSITVDAYNYTTDGGAGGVDILKWYEKYTGSFWVYLAYDKYSNFAQDGTEYNKLGRYNQVMEVFFSSFSYNITKRGNSLHDYWTVSLALEEA